MIDSQHLVDNDEYQLLLCRIFTDWEDFIQQMTPIIQREIKYNVELLPVQAKEEELKKSEERETHMNVITGLLIEAWHWCGTVDHLYCYMGNYWIQLSKIKFYKLVRSIWATFRTDCREKDSNEIYKALQTQHLMNVDEFNPNENLLPFNNGVMDLSNNYWCEHHYSNYFLYCFHWNYNPAATCPKFMAAIIDMIPAERSRNYLLHYLAYCLTARIDIQQAQIWIGPPGCGKSSLLEAFINLMGPFAFRIPINKLCTDKRYRAEVLGKRVIWGSEMGGFKLQKESINELKNIITDGIIDGERKFEHPINFTNKAKLLYCSNDTPIAAGADDAFFQRWRFIQFNKIYRGTDQNQNRFFQTIFLEERDGIVNYLMSLIPNLETVLNTPDKKESKKIWLSYCSNTAMFLDACCERRPQDTLPCANLYKKYVEWCANEQETAQDQSTFEKYMSALGYQIVTTMTEDNKKFVKHFIGIAMKVWDEIK